MIRNVKCSKLSAAVLVTLRIFENFNLHTFTLQHRFIPGSISDIADDYAVELVHV